jgi:hypothetical protein
MRSAIADTFDDDSQKIGHSLAQQYALEATRIFLNEFEDAASKQEQTIFLEKAKKSMLISGSIERKKRRNSNNSVQYLNYLASGEPFKLWPEIRRCKQILEQTTDKQATKVHVSQITV